MTVLHDAPDRKVVNAWIAAHGTAERRDLAVGLMRVCRDSSRAYLPHITRRISKRRLACWP